MNYMVYTLMNVINRLIEPFRLVTMFGLLKT